MRLQIGLFLILLLCFSACEEPINIDVPDGDSRLVVNSNFSPDDFITVLLSKERPLSQDSTVYISNAQVRVLINDRQIGNMSLVVPQADSYPNEPYYISDFLPRAGRNYTLEVEMDGFPKVRSANIAPNAVPIQEVKLDSVITTLVLNDRRETLYDIYGSITINDPASIENYYHFAETILPIDWFTVIGGDTVLLFNQEYFLAPVFNTDGQDPNILRLQHEYGFLLSDKDFDGEKKTIPFRASVQFDAKFRLVNRLNVLFRSVSADYYRYHSTLTRQLLANESPFSEPVIVYNNIENGFGNFSGYSTAVDSISLGP